MPQQPERPAEGAAAEPVARRTGRHAACALALLAMLALASWADRYLRGGLSANWFASAGGERHELGRTVERRVRFPNPLRLQARYAQLWDRRLFGRDSFPHELDLQLAGTLTIPAGEPRRIQALSASSLELRADGEPLDGRALRPGPHAFAARWTSPLWGVPLSLRFAWSAPGSGLSEVPAAAFAPAAPSHGPRVLLWSVVAALAGGLLLVARSPLPLARGARFLALAGILALGTGLRAFDYDVVPDFRETADELAATWNGWQLLHDGTTRGLSVWYREYGERVSWDRYVREDGQVFRAVRPYLDHPPLMHALVGAAAHLAGSEDWRDARLRHARLVPVALSSLTVALVFWLGRLVYPRGAEPWLGALVYAALPNAVLNGRLVKEDVLATALAAASLGLAVGYLADGRRGRLLGSAALAGLAALAKLTGLAVVAAPAAAAVARGRWRLAGLSLALALSLAGLYVAYGLGAGAALLGETLRLQGSRPPALGFFAPFLSGSLVVENHVGAGWLLFLWLAAASAWTRAAGPRERLAAGAALALCFAIGLGGGTWWLGWYALPVLPLLAVGTGRFLAELWRRPRLVPAAWLWLVGGLYSVQLALLPSEWRAVAEQVPLRALAVAGSALLLGPLLAELRPSRASRGLGRACVGLALAATLAAWASFVLRYDAMRLAYDNHDRAGRPRSEFAESVLGPPPPAEPAR